MKPITLVLVAVAVAGVVTGWQSSSTGGDAQPAPQSAKEVRGASPYIQIKNEPPPKLIVDEPLPDGLPQGIVWIQYRTENCRILPVFGKEALKLSPRVGHLHVRVDDLPWLWAHTSDINTSDTYSTVQGLRYLDFIACISPSKAQPAKKKKLEGVDLAGV